MALPVPTSLRPMLGRLVRDLPEGAVAYEPKWDGFRCLVFCEGGEVDLRSRHGRPLARYFPELVDALASLAEPAFVVDAEIVLAADGRFDFPALMRRLHPARSHVRRLAAEQPASLVAFDCLAAGARDLREHPFAERREALAGLLAGARPPLHLTPHTLDAAVAREWLARFCGGGVDGVMAKPLDAPYQAGARAVLKVKPERTADCVVAGFRAFADRPAASSLLLGLYDARGALLHVGVVASFPEEERRRLVEGLAPLSVPLERHPWRDGYLLGGGATGRLKGSAGRWDPREMPLDWFPVAPERVLEVAFTQVDEGRFRHPGRMRRWRPDRDPRSCTVDQLDAPDVPGDLLAADAVD
jgi:ATP-dependent DNA ligase